MAVALTQLATCPGVGKSGRPARVRTNFFEVTSIPLMNIHHYDVHFSPAGTPAIICKKVWQAFEQSRPAILHGTRSVFNGRSNVFSPKELNLGENGVASFKFDWQEEDERGQPKRSRGLFDIRLRKVGEVNMEELGLFLNGKVALSNNCITAIMVLDVLIRYVPSLTHVTIGRSIFTPAGSRPLPSGAEVWQGYFQSARPGVGRMMVNVDVSASAFYNSGPLLDLVAKILDRHSLDQLRRGMSEREHRKVESIIKGLRIRVMHRGGGVFKYKIKKLTPHAAEITTFEDDQGNELTVVDYFLRQYNKRLLYPFLPCVVVGGKKDNFMPMEVCEVFPGQRMTKKLNEKQTAEMVKVTVTKPNIRANKITAGLPLLQHQNNPYMEAFGMVVNTQMSDIPARILPPPKITYHLSSQEAVFTPQQGSWNLRGKKVAQGATLGSWSVVSFAGIISIPTIQRFLRGLCQVFSDTGMNVVKRDPPIMYADPQGNIDRTLKEAWLKAGNSAKANPQLIVCILPNTGVPLYAEIKRITDTVIGVPSQCLQAKHIHDAKKQYCANVCLKVNMKLGGMNVFLPSNEIPFIADRPTIVIGADVTHPPPGDVSKPSIAALVGSMDAKAARFSSCVRIQPHRVEIIANMQDMIRELLKNFYRECGQKPARILVYRDGVSEGQFPQVMEAEVAAIKAACASLDKDYRPSLTFVVVQKRHHARFFPIAQRDSDRTGNCLPGTVVDTDIVHPFEFDFYLQSHAGLIGTCRPCHYFVLHDENNFTSDSFQELSYRMCYTYGRATCSVSMVPAAYYAHLLAARARFHRLGETWSDTDVASSEAAATTVEEQMASYSNVKPDLVRVMFYM